jgi:phosphatidylinositol-3-phosphatase
MLALAACSAPSAQSHQPGASRSTPSGSAPAPSGAPTSRAAAPSGTPNRPDHVVVAIFENKGFEQVIGSGAAPAFDALAGQGVLFEQSYAITHPSQPNYLALFSGDTQGVTNDACPQRFSAPNLGRQLLDTGLTVTGYAESLPAPGYAGCSNGDYARKHAPWTNFADLPPAVGQPYSSFPTDYQRLPTVAFVVPNLCNDMHNCSIRTGDRWLAANLQPYATWARTHHSILIVTFDEDDSSGPNLIPTIVVGDGITPAHSTQRIDQYSMLRTIENCYGLPALGHAAQRQPLAGVCPA